MTGLKLSKIIQRYIIETDNGIFDIPDKQVFENYEQWKKYYGGITA
jgi:hypothetical protein